MKNYFTNYFAAGFISLSVLLLSGMKEAHAAFFYIDFRGGANWSTISDSDGEYAPGYLVGAAGRFMPMDLIGVSAGVDFQTRSADYSVVDSQIHYVDIPVTGVLNLGLGPVSLYLEPGLFYAIPLKSTFYDVGIAEVKAEKFLGFVGRIRGELKPIDSLGLGVEAYGKIPFQSSTRDRIVAASVSEDKIYDFGISAVVSFGFL